MSIRSIPPIDIQFPRSTETVLLDTGVKGIDHTDPYDLDIEFTDLSTGSEVPHNELITSKSLCTPGCGKTGTYNSYCC
jgi:gallidermin/nisin family lantibiotic